MEQQFTNDRPIYLQLMDGFKARIASGGLAPGQRLDSVRDLALAMRVNPNTMQKALAELEREALVRTERTSGRFITDDAEKIAALRESLAQAEVAAFAQKMKALGFKKAEVVKAIKGLEL